MKKHNFKTEGMNVSIESAYKYLPREFAEMLVNEGKIRISPLNDFQNISSSDPRKDVSEATVVVSGGKFDYENPIVGNFKTPEVSFRATGPDGKEVESSHITYEFFSSFRYKLAPVYGYSTCLVQDSAMHAHFNSDTIVKIDNPSLFAASMLHAFHMRIVEIYQQPNVGMIYAFFKPVRYSGHVVKQWEMKGSGEVSRQGQDPRSWTQIDSDVYFVKDPCYAREKEFRFIWPCDGFAFMEQYHPLPVMDIHAPELMQYCSMVG
ncbi:hypothetical protein OAU50_02140 [Planctomycetota bacterium]|nr:hypothetical protein [Planctomycetota bacterium]